MAIDTWLNPLQPLWEVAVSPYLVMETIPVWLEGPKEVWALPQAHEACSTPATRGEIAHAGQHSAQPGQLGNKIHMSLLAVPCVGMAWL